MVSRAIEGRDHPAFQFKFEVEIQWLKYCSKTH